MLECMARRARAERAVRDMAEVRECFRINHVLNSSDHLDESNRELVRLVLHDLADAGIVEQKKPHSPIWQSKIGVETGTGSTEGQRWQQGPILILHAFADYGVEGEALGAHGEVIRVGLNPRNTNQSRPIQADCNQLPFREKRFDLGVFHPECARFSQVTSISGNPEDHPNQIPLARELGERYCDQYILENKPKAAKEDDGLREPEKGGSLVTLNGRMFGLPLHFERAFECSFPVDTPPVQQPLDQEVSPYFYADRSTEWWRAVKGYSGNYTKQPVAKNAVPRPFADFLMRAYWRHVGEADSQPARSSHND